MNETDRARQHRRRRPAELVSRARDSARTQLWPLPVAGVGLALVLGVVLPLVDAGPAENLPDGLRAWLFGGGAGAARTVLDAIASSLITVTSLTFSLTVVTLQLASSQFSPRLLRTFTRDLVVQSTLALFLGTFTYALTVLRTVRSESSRHSQFVPDISITVAFVLAVLSVVGLVLFLAHLAQTIRVENMLRNVHGGATEAVERLLDETDSAPLDPVSLLPRTAPTLLTAPASGFLVRVDEATLLEIACDAGLVVLVDVTPGSSVVRGTPVGAVWLSGSVPDAPPLEELLERVAAALVTGFERTDLQDTCFGLRQLTDVAVKALSPGINDPTTAVHALGHSAALVCEMTSRDLGPRVLRAHDDVVRVVLRRPGLPEVLALAVEQPARYGAAEPEVLRRLLALLREVGWVCRPDQRPAVAAQLSRLRDVIEGAALLRDDRDSVTAGATLVEHALEGRWDLGVDGPAPHRDVGVR